MTKRRKLSPKEQLARSIETYSKHRIECCICGKSESTCDISAWDYAEILHSDGWRSSDSDKFCVIGPMCPECFETPDAERGE